MVSTSGNRVRDHVFRLGNWSLGSWVENVDLIEQSARSLGSQTCPLLCGYALVSAKTSSAGPGYHAFFISCLDQIEKRLGLAWNWSEDERVGGEPTDETCHALSRDFSALQSDMAASSKACSR